MVNFILAIALLGTRLSNGFLRAWPFAASAVQSVLLLGNPFSKAITRSLLFIESRNKNKKNAQRSPKQNKYRRNPPISVFESVRCVIRTMHVTYGLVFTIVKCSPIDASILLFYARVFRANSLSNLKCQERPKFRPLSR